MRGIVARALLAGFVGWFALSVVDPPGLHHCPMHDPALYSHHTGTASRAKDPTHPGSGHMVCTCIGPCAGGAVAGIATVAAFPAFLAPIVFTAPSGPAHVAPRVRPLHIPFATGPPVSTV